MAIIDSMEMNTADWCICAMIADNDYQVHHIFEYLTVPIDDDDSNRVICVHLCCRLHSFMYGTSGKHTRCGRTQMLAGRAEAELQGQLQSM